MTNYKRCYIKKLNDKYFVFVTNGAYIDRCGPFEKYEEAAKKMAEEIEK